MVLKIKHDCSCCVKKLAPTLCLPLKKNNRHTTPPQTNIALIMPRPKGIDSRHKSGTGNNKGRKRTTPFDNR